MDAKQKIDDLIEKLEEGDPKFIEEFKQEMIDFKKKQDLQLQRELEEESNNE